jgi:hypothetical protein
MTDHEQEVQRMMAEVILKYTFRLVFHFYYYSCC